MIPAELKAEARWIAWRYVWRAGKQGRPGRWTKEPINTRTGRLAKSNDPATWGSFDEATAFYRDAANKVDGVGFVLGDGWCGFDGDDVRDPVTGELTPTGRAMFDALPSYTEVSPSATGVKIFGRGRLPGDKGRKNPQLGFEAYSVDRYFAVTGHALGGREQVTDLQHAIDARLVEFLPTPAAAPAGPPRGKKPDRPAAGHPAVGRPTHASPADDEAERIADRLVLDDIGASPDGARYRRLVGGDFTDWGGDESSAHQSLCNWIAARVGNDPPRIRRILSHIPAVTNHPKWERADYWERTIAKAVEGTGAADRGPRQARPSDNTDLTNSRRFVHEHRDRLRWCGLQSTFYAYDPETAVWCPDTGRRAEYFAKLTVDGMIQGAAKDVCRTRQGGDPQEIAAAVARLNWAVRSADARRIVNMVRLASSEPELAVDPADFDADPWLLNCPNAAVDLTTGRRCGRGPDALLTKCAATLFDPDAPCPTWERFILTTLGNDQELVRWVQRYLGYCLSGDVSLQLLPVFWGGGGNGKSTLIDTVSSVVGPAYWGKAAPDLMLSKGRDAHPTEVADLHGLRLAFTVETDEGRKLNEARIKELTGDATLKARRMRENFWEFQRTNKLVLITNHKPRVETGGDGMWRRLRLVPFTQRFWDPDKGENGPEHLKAVGGLKDKLLKERAGILAWLVRGCVDCYRDGLQLGPCKAIAAATQEYQSGEDVFAQFVAETLDRLPGDTERVPATDVRNRYQQWAADNGAKPLTPRALTEKLLAIGVTRTESNGKTYYGGVRLRGAPQVCGVVKWSERPDSGLTPYTRTVLERSTGNRPSLTT